MKTALISTIIFFLSTLCAAGQLQKNNGRIEIGLGASVPTGSFGQANVAPFGGHVTGAAKTGETLEISYHFSTRNAVGFSFTLFGNRNPINTKELETAYASKSFGGVSTGPFPIPPSPSSGRYYKNWQFDKANWYSTGLMTGGNINLPITGWKNFSFDAKARVGVIVAFSPELNGNAHTDTSTITFYQSAEKAFGFCYNASAGVAYSLNNHTHLHFNAAYLGTAQMKFLDVRTVNIIAKGTTPTTQMQEFSSATTDLKQSINMVNISIGVSFIL